MPRFIMLCGPSASGKSTFRSNLLSQSPNAVVISSDDILEGWAEADGITYQEAFLAHRSKTDDLMKDIASEAFDADVDIIWDQTHLTREQRRVRMLDIPDSYDRVAVAFEAPADLLYERARKREALTGKHVPEHIMQGQIDSYELPDFDEGFDSIVVVSEPGNKVKVL